jgi:carbonic anhydrase
MCTIQATGNIPTIQSLWREYWKELGLPDEFQGFAQEMRGLPGVYRAPRGALALAFMDGIAAGTIALRPLRQDAAEAKRLYVKPEFRRRGVGRALMEWVIQHARTIGYKKLYGDTLPNMVGQLRMYQELGFRRLDHPYSPSPTPGAVYMELDLQAGRGFTVGRGVC